LSGAEVIAAAEQQLETAGGIEDTPFVTITVTIDAADSTKRIVSAYQVRKIGNKHFANALSCPFIHHLCISDHKAGYGDGSRRRAACVNEFGQLWN
jgi:hypothetical protein